MDPPLHPTAPSDAAKRRAELSFAPMNPPRIAPSLLSCDFGRIAEEVRRVEAAGADWLHVDVMDGHFVPNLTLGPPIVAVIRDAATRPLDVHLMIEEPGRWAQEYADAGAEVITFHTEACASESEIRATIEAFRRAGVARVGVALKPETELDSVLGLLDEIDIVLVMSVFPGFGGQSFREEVLPKVEALRAAGWTGLLEMDGGLDADTIPRCAAAGCDVFVAGSAIFGARDMADVIARFRASAAGRNKNRVDYP